MVITAVSDAANNLEQTIEQYLSSLFLQLYKVDKY